MSFVTLTKQHFEPLLGHRFRTEWEEGATELQLSELASLPAPRRREPTGQETQLTEGPFRKEPFSLIFRGPLDAFLPQRIYRMTPESSTEPLEIFLVPIRQDSDAFVYQAVFA